MSDNIAIKVDNVSKDFRFSSNRASTLKSLFTGFSKSKKVKSKELQHALKNISFEIKQGEFFGIVGRNGSGKSTLLKILAGIYQPTKGETNVHGRLVPFIELGVGFNPELTGRENVYLNGALLNFSEKEIDAFYDEVVEFAELGQFMDKKLKNYSSGMQVRLAFSMAIRAKADILLIDEVLAVGDADFQRKCFEYFNHLKKTKTTVVFVSHDMEAVRQYCDRVILIEDSVIVNSGSPEKIALAYIRQFNQKDSTDEVQAEESTEKRWGDKKVVIESIKVKVEEDQITVTEVLRVRGAVDGYVAGVRIKTSAGNHVTGTNTKLEHKKLVGLKKGSKQELVWKLPNILSDGAYLVDAAVTYSDEITVLDWWEDSTKFDVRKKRRIPYAVDPGFSIDIK